MPAKASAEVAVPFPVVPAASLPWLTVEQMAEADRLAVDEFDISLLQMMEHAGSTLAELVTALAPTGDVTVLAGGGNNGGGGLCAARHLINRGRRVEVILGSDRLGPAPTRHLKTLTRMGVIPRSEPGLSTVVVDALVGYGLAGPLHGRVADLARWASMNHFVVSLDFPSGHGFEGGIRADAVHTLALPKEGLRGFSPLYLGDLGLPSALWARMGFDVGTVFAEGRIVRIDG